METSSPSPPPPPDPAAALTAAQQRAELEGQRGHEAQYHALLARGRQLIDQALHLRHYHPTSTHLSIAAHHLTHHRPTRPLQTQT